MRKSKVMTIVISVLCTIAIGVGATFALLVSSSGPLDNTFTIGSVEITLSETSGNEYYLLPGATLTKDPRVTVKSGSEDCYLFVKLKESHTLHHYLTYEVESEWSHLDGEADVYYISVGKPSRDVDFFVLEGNCYTVKETVTKEMLKNMTASETLIVYAIAVQSYGFETAVDAWASVKADLTV